MKVIGFGAALVDKQFLIKDDALNDLGIEKGLMTLNLLHFQFSFMSLPFYCL